MGIDNRYNVSWIARQSSTEMRTAAFFFPTMWIGSWDFSDLARSSETLAFLLCVWHASNQACSKRLKGILHLWLPKYEEATGVVLSLEHQVLILRMSLLTTIPKTLNCNAPGKSICNPYRGITKEGSITNNHEQKNNSGILQNQSLPCPPLRLPFIMRQHARGAGRCELSAHPR